MKKLIEKIIAENTEEDIRAKVDDAILNYVDDDWEDEYESEYEWYCECGRGEAESDVLREIIDGKDPDLPSDDYCTVFDALKEEWDL